MTANIQALQRVMRKQHDHPAEMVELNADHQYQPEAPRSWQITEERKAAIQMGLDYLEYGYAKSGREDIHEHAGQLRAMLGEAGQ